MVGKGDPDGRPSGDGTGVIMDLLGLVTSGMVSTLSAGTGAPAPSSGRPMIVATEIPPSGSAFVLGKQTEVPPEEPENPSNPSNPGSPTVIITGISSGGSVIC